MLHPSKSIVKWPGLCGGGKLYSRTFAPNTWGMGTVEKVGYNAWIVREGPLLGKGYSRFTEYDEIKNLMDKCFAVNAEGVKNLALACHEENIKIIHFSTDYVFAGDGNKPYCEDDERQPLNVYGESKLAGEKYLQEL